MIGLRKAKIDIDNLDNMCTERLINGSFIFMDIISRYCYI